jgi:hypothetical protein
VVSPGFFCLLVCGSFQKVREEVNLRSCGSQH